jgi:2-amino-4-hydroxy-6-hydroxymethyldihydropteridine diphosphokinase
MKEERVTAYIGVGSKISPREHILKAYELWKNRVTVAGTSNFYRTKPLARKEQPDYINGVWRIATALSPRELKKTALSVIETALHRQRCGDAYASRTIDLDLLVFGDVVSREKGFVIPDPDIYTRPFIAVPLCELDPRLLLPDTGVPVKTAAKPFENHSMVYDDELTRVLREKLPAAEKQEGDRQQRWSNEYNVLRGIHLEYRREDVPPVVREFQSFLQRKNIAAPQRILDAGCGKGRIGIHLARAGHEIVGFDFVDSVLQTFDGLAQQYGLADRVNVFRQDINNRWQVADASVDCVFAVTVIEDLVTNGQQVHFKDECIRVLAPRGLLVIEHYTPGDGYYGPLSRTTGPSPGGCVDPHNTLQFKLSTGDEIKELLAPAFLPVFARENTWDGIKYDRPYRRHSEILIFQRAEKPDV